MQRPGANQADMRPDDFLCDFCRAPWDGAFPMVEGHQGSLISGDCLTAAYRAVVLGGGPTAPGGYTCTMCLERRDEPGWSAPGEEIDAQICRRCIRQAATKLDRDPDWPWSKPAPQ